MVSRGVTLGLFLFVTNVLAYGPYSATWAWCGKPYLSVNVSSPPGGDFQYPPVQPNPMLYVTVQPRYTIFLDTDEVGDLIVDASLDYRFGQPFQSASFQTVGNGSGTPAALKLDLHSQESGILLNTSSFALNTTGNIMSFSFSSFKPRLEPYQVTVSGTSPDGKLSYNASTEIFILPSRNYGSAVKIDKLYGATYVQNAYNNYTGWYRIFPNGMFADGGLVINSMVFNLTNLTTYASLGYNTLNVVPDGATPDQSYNYTSLAQYWDYMDEINLFNIYNMQFAFQNSTRISLQVEMWKNRSTLHSYYIADEPDGWQYPLNSTLIAYQQIKKLDPYHPVQLVLNCQNFYYGEYTSGADIVLEDAYPIGVDPTYSIPWGTPVNTTYGDCGCDNCKGSLLDVSDRLDDFYSYQNNIPYGGTKQIWSTVQAFGAQDYWVYQPGYYEVAAMMMLSINHDAKALTYWIYPPPAITEIQLAAGPLFGNIFQTEEVMDFIFGGMARKNLPAKWNGVGSVAVDSNGAVDASAWINGGKMLVGVVNSQYVDGNGSISITLPEKARSGNVSKLLYGNEGWVVNGDQLSKSVGLRALEVNLLLLDLDSAGNGTVSKRKF